jgi:hypothetical protein
VQARLSEIIAGAEELVGGLAHALAGASAGWLLVGVALHLCNQLARGRGWFAILRAALDGDPRLRRRDAIAAWIAGAGAGGLVTARLGDALRVLLVTRRLPETGSVVAGTLVAEGAGELAGGLLLLPVALGVGVGVPFGPLVWPAAAALPAAGAVVAWRRRAVRRAPAGRRLRVAAPRRFARPLAGVRRGCAPLAAPGPYARRVAPWQLASRVLRLASLAAFLVAFHLPATPAAVLLVVFAQGSGHLVPFSPAAAGASVAVLAATFAPVTGIAAPAARLGAFLIGMSTILTVIGVVVAAAIVLLRGADWRAVAATPRVPAAARARS